MMVACCCIHDNKVTGARERVTPTPRDLIHTAADLTLLYTNILSMHLIASFVFLFL